MRILQQIGLVAFLTLGVTVSDTIAQDKALKDPDPQRFAKQIQKFAEADRESPPKEGVTVFVGSSSIRLWNLPKYFGKLEAINRGFGGSQISDVQHFAQKVMLKYKPKKIIFFCGGNDIAYGKPPARVLGDFQAFTKLLFHELPETKLIVLAIKPAPGRQRFLGKVREANQLIRREAKKNERILFLDGAFDLLVNDKGEIREELYVADRIHLNEQGYRLWTKMLMPHLKEKAK